MKPTVIILVNYNKGGNSSREYESNDDECGSFDSNRASSFKAPQEEGESQKERVGLD
jgi:hypothetical protein